MSGALLVRTEGPVRILVNSNPAARNAITPELYDAMPAALRDAAADPARDAFFSVTYVKLGLMPDGATTAFLAQCLSRQVMTALCLTGERISAGRLHELGAVNRLAEPGQALTGALALVASVANGLANASARVKLLCQNAGHASLDAQLEPEAQLMVESQGDDEAAEGIRAFFDQRAPDFVSLRRRAG